MESGRTVGRILTGRRGKAKATSISFVFNRPSPARTFLCTGNWFCPHRFRPAWSCVYACGTPTWFPARNRGSTPASWRISRTPRERKSPRRESPRLISAKVPRAGRTGVSSSRCHRMLMRWTSCRSFSRSHPARSISRGWRFFLRRRINCRSPRRSFPPRQLSRPMRLPFPRNCTWPATQLQTADGKVVWLQGLCLDSLEWSGKGEHIEQSIPVATGRVESKRDSIAGQSQLLVWPRSLAEKG